MAHAAHLSQLADGLITSIVGENGSNVDSKQLHDRTLKGLKNTSHARTNQFDVQSKLAGLVEKFSVLNRDGLAEGLQTRLDELPAKSKWLPEILSLLLELSDRPLEKTRLEDVEAASKLDKSEPTLTWADIIAEEPLDEADVWDDVERGYHSSDDDLTADEHGSDDETQATSIGEDDPVALARLHVLQVDDGELSEVKEVQRAMAAASTGQPVSELTLIRETLSMLHGQPTSIFYRNDTGGSLFLGESVKLNTASKNVVRHALESLVNIGSSVDYLRVWTRSEQQAPTTRSCQSALAAEMKALSAQLAEIEKRYISPGIKGTASIVQLRADIESLACPFMSLAKLVQEHAGDPSNTSLRLLDTLYNQACVAQLSDDVRTFETVTRMLVAGLNAYLRPVATWVSTGECNGSCDFFVVENNSDCELGRLWHDCYALRQQANGETAAPIFLRPFVNRIFALGKGRAFLRALNGEGDAGQASCALPAFAIETSRTTLLPFSQALADALEMWIAKQSKDQTPLLRKSILRDHGLLSTVDALQHVFFSQNGRRFQTFAETLFWRLDHRARWQDGFLLTELAQSTLGSDQSVASDRILAHIIDLDSDDAGSTPTTSSSIRQLQTLQLQYHLLWPLQNITSSAYSMTYTRAITFLLQIYRAKYLLHQHILSLRHFNTYTTPLTTRVQTTLRLQQRLSSIVDTFHAHVTSTSELLSIRLQDELERAAGIDDMAVIWWNHERLLGVSLLVAEKLAPVRGAVIGLLESAERLMKIFELVATTQAADGKETGEDAGAGDVVEMTQEVDRSVSFISSGLRGIARASGNTTLEELAERLEWAVH